MEIGPSYASIIDQYLYSVREILGKAVGRVWWTGKENSFVRISFQKNELGKIHHQIATFLDFLSTED